MFDRKNLNTHHSKMTAFTLAEVLITLGIIGFVFALSLPSLTAHLERYMNAIKLEKAYSALGQYVKMFSAENDCDGGLGFCAPGNGEFVYKFAKYLHDEQGFWEPNTRCIGKPNCYTWMNYKKNGQASNGISLGPAYSVVSPNKTGYYLVSRSGLYAYFISIFMYDNYYNIKGDTFRARIHIMTDMRHKGYFKEGFGGRLDGNKGHYYPTLGKNMFEVYIMNSGQILPNGTSKCGNIRDSWAYYCHPLDTSSSGNCSYESGDFSACLQKVIDDGWKIKYKY